MALTVDNLIPLEWDTRHFGFAVGRILPHSLTEEALRATLIDARELGIQLLYCATDPEVPVSATILRDFAGSLVDKKATFGSGLPPRQRLDANRANVQFSTWGGESATPELEALAMSAGEFSRFRVDPPIPAERFAALYREWLRNSIGGKLADAVIVAMVPESEAPVGMVTLKVAGDAASIGLIAVGQRFRGRGIATGLIEAVHAEALRHGAASCTVVTQQANHPACRLYESQGYRLQSLEAIYHFWPCAGRIET